MCICCRPSVCRLSVCNARASYSAGSNFRQCFYATWYDAHPLISTENFCGDRPIGTSVGGVKRKRASQVFLYISKAVSRNRCNIGGKLILITNRKSYMSFRLVSQSVTLNDLEQVVALPLFCVISPNSVASGAHCVKVVEDVVVKTPRSLSYLLMNFLFNNCCWVLYGSFLHSVLEHGNFSINISQGSVATGLRCAGIFNNQLFAALLMSHSVKEFWKSFSIW